MTRSRVKLNNSRFVYSISNGTFPGKNYQQVYPPADHAADGGFQWPFYLGMYGNYTISNYAVGGSVCSNDLTPLFGNPDVLTGQQAWFIEDHITGYGTPRQKLHLDPQSFVVIIWVGTNDVGIHSILTSDTPTLVSLADVADCQLNAIRKMHKLGARRFILNSLIPLHRTRLYADSDEGTIYWPDPHNGTVWHKGVYNLVHSLNRMLNDGVQNLNREWKGDGKVEWFDTYRFFEDVYNNSERYFNGSIAANVTGHCHQCLDPHDWRLCDMDAASAAFCSEQSHSSTTSSMSIETIPIIDFAKFGNGDSPESREIGKKFFEACRDVGFAYLVNTGIPQERVDGMFKWSAKLFELPTEVKKKAPHPPEGWKHRGYSAVGVEQISQMVFDTEELAVIRKGKFPDFKESFDIGDETSPARPGLENIWLPEEDLPGFREHALDYCRACRVFQMEQLLPALSIGMGLDKDFFNEYHKNGENQLRLVHYPEAPTEVFETGEKGRIGAHTDYLTCTILFQDDVGGLEVESPSEPGVFIPAPPVPGAAVSNIGDLLMRRSNDLLKSTLHRVRAPPRSADDDGMTRKRFSLPYVGSSNWYLYVAHASRRGA
ncbi:hypothetical protein PQX77_017815 [Marasmius sp. AFHP31]|nr:hypothetical protein PQX77_017815 [Marasmius sp. AFHP31]